ncbi:MAG: acyl carrier protein [Maribacter sp.]|jgi:acyl carrier protein
MEETIIKYIIDELHGGREDLEIFPEDDLLGSGLIESMAMMRLIQYIEETYDFRVSPQEMTIENFMTVEAMANYVRKVKA